MGLFAGCDSGYSEETVKAGQEAVGMTIAGRPQIGTPAPEFQLTDMQGRTVALSDLRGKVVLLNFWATWCFPCRVEMPSMEEAYQSFRSQGLEVLAVSVDEQGARVTKPFQEEKGLTFRILHDTDYQVGLTYGARSLPMTYLIDRQGIIKHRVFGSREWNTPEAGKMLSKLLEEPVQAPSRTM
jgi:peroxiredoxin